MLMKWSFDDHDDDFMPKCHFDYEVNLHFNYAKWVNVNISNGLN